MPNKLKILLLCLFCLSACSQRLTKLEADISSLKKQRMHDETNHSFLLFSLVHLKELKALKHEHPEDVKHIYKELASNKSTFFIFNSKYIVYQRDEKLWCSSSFPGERSYPVVNLSAGVIFCYHIDDSDDRVTGFGDPYNLDKK